MSGTEGSKASLNDRRSWYAGLAKRPTSRSPAKFPAVTAQNNALANGQETITLENRQYIVPMDYDESTDDDFRGITAVELSVLLKQLTWKTSNVAVVLDCCHSALMSRNRGDLRIRQLIEGMGAAPGCPSKPVAGRGSRHQPPRSGQQPERLAPGRL